MYQHLLQLFQNENEFNENLNDYVYKHIVYSVLTLKTDPETNVNTSTVTTGVVYFDEADANNFIPSANVTQEVLKQWVEEKIDIDALQALNLQKLSK